MKPDDELIHAKVWTEKYPAWWHEVAELAADVDDVLVGTDLIEHFAKRAVAELYFRDGTHFRISRKGIMRDYIVRAEMAWGVRPLGKIGT